MFIYLVKHDFLANSGPEDSLVAENQVTAQLALILVAHSGSLAWLYLLKAVYCKQSWL